MDDTKLEDMALVRVLHHVMQFSISSSVLKCQSIAPRYAIQC